MIFFVLQINVFVRIIKILKSTNKSVWLKMKLTQKVTNIVSQLPTYCDKGTKNMGQVTNKTCNTRFTLFFKTMFFYELIKFSNLQPRVFGSKWRQIKKLPTLLVRYQYIVIKVPTIWARLPIFLATLDLLCSSNLYFCTNY